MEAESLDKDESVIIWQHVFASVLCKITRRFAASKILGPDWMFCPSTVSAAFPDRGAGLSYDFHWKHLHTWN